MFFTMWWRGRQSVLSLSTSITFIIMFLSLKQFKFYWSLCRCWLVTLISGRGSGWNIFLDTIELLLWCIETTPPDACLVNNFCTTSHKNNLETRRIAMDCYSISNRRRIYWHHTAARCYFIEIRLLSGISKTKTWT